MAKASADDIDCLINFFRFVDEFMEYGTHTPENDELEEESIELTDTAFVERLRKLWGGRFKPPGVFGSWSRVVQGCEILIRECCDPNLDHLEWRPDVKAFLESQQSEVPSEPA